MDATFVLRSLEYGSRYETSYLRCKIHHTELARGTILHQVHSYLDCVIHHSSFTKQSARRVHDLEYFLFMARAGLTGESRPRNDDVVPMRLARIMVIDRIQLAVYCLSNCFARKSLTCFVPRSYRYKHSQ